MLKLSLWTVSLLTALCVSFSVKAAQVPAAEVEATAPQAEYQAFVTQTGNDIINVLVHKEISMDERKSQFRQILQTKFSIPSIGKFVLARFWRQADNAQKARYLKLFETAIVENYAAQFDNYANEKLEVMGSESMDDGGVLVRSRVLRPSGAEPLMVDFKVFEQKDPQEKDASPHQRKKVFKIVDIVVNGVSMSITQRSEYASLIQQAGGDLNQFLDALNKKYGA